MTKLLIFTPTIADTMRPETEASIKAQQTDIDWVWEVGYHNPFPGEKMKNVVAQYQRARQLMLDGGYDAMLTVEHDMIIPADAVELMMAHSRTQNAGVVYAPYMLRHGTKVLSTWQKTDGRNPGMTLSMYPKELATYKARGWGEIAGVGWGCTLIQRSVLQQVQVHDEDGSAGDIPFATDCLRLGIKQIGAFDVPCQHYSEGVWLDAYPEHNSVHTRVLALVDVNVSVNWESKRLEKGRYYSLPLEVAQEQARAGYLKITTQEREQPDITEREMATDPKAATRGRRRANNATA